ncbi:MAG: glucosyl-3-phosphoglycerate synthase [Gordonia sp. (in: high G+C Gram-positive bacteria)]
MNRDSTPFSRKSERKGAREAAQEWLASNSWDVDWNVDELVAAKRGRTISVVLPALDEEATVANVVASIMPLHGTLVDEVVVVDSGSVDDTRRCAAEAGARIETREAALPEVPVIPGKGEVLWRSLAVTTGDIVVFVDSDLIDPDPSYVPRLVGPLLVTPGLHLVKGYYRRPLMGVDGVDPLGGGRVTELTVRPLIAAFRPELAAVVQPLAGEYAGTRELLTSIPFAAGYGVEIGMLLDTLDRYGMSAIGQSRLGTRMHRNRPLHELGAMARQIVTTLLGRVGVDDSASPLLQFIVDDDALDVRSHQPVRDDRPPMNEVLGRRAALSSRVS